MAIEHAVGALTGAPVDESGPDHVQVLSVTPGYIDTGMNAYPRFGSSLPLPPRMAILIIAEEVD